MAPDSVRALAPFSMLISTLFSGSFSGSAVSGPKILCKTALATSLCDEYFIAPHAGAVDFLEAM